MSTLTITAPAATVRPGSPGVPGSERVLTPEALQLLGDLHRRFDGRRLELLAARRERRAALAAGGSLTLLPETEAVREDATWRVASPAPGLARRHVEITGPVSRSMAVNALNSGADVWMADFEDATSPTWHNVVDGQLNLVRWTQGELDFVTEAGKEYRVGPTTPTVVVRPRGWHLPEAHLEVDGEETSGSLTDVGLYFLHCAQAMIDTGAGPYFYLPKLESHLEARLWNDVFLFLQERFGIPRGTVRATVLIETIPAAFEMDEILFELREHSGGLNAGRWDYIFSIIKTFRDDVSLPALPDRPSITMTTPFMRAYSQRLVATCHKRGAQAIGGMAAFVPSRTDPVANENALANIRADKDRDAADGFDGSWVAHPGLVPTAAAAFAAVLGDRDGQLDVPVGDPGDVTDLLDLASATGSRTAAGLHANIAVSLRYLDAWLQGSGAVAINNLMEDAATVEISRSQVWQWRAAGVVLEDGTPVIDSVVAAAIEEEADRIRTDAGPDSRLDDAVALFRELALGPYLDFFTEPAYRRHLAD